MTRTTTCSPFLDWIVIDNVPKEALIFICILPVLKTV